MDQDRRTENLHNLDMKHQETIHVVDLVVKDEDARRLRVRLVLLEDEIATLKDKIGQKDGRINQLMTEGDDTRIQLDSMSEKCREQETQLRVQARQHSNLKTELLSLDGVTQDSAKLLSEKLALTRELALLRPEIEHLRSQATQQKELLAEKLVLERQLNTLEVELANEKRAIQRATQRQENQDSEVEEELRQQVQELEKKLASEKRTKQRGKKNQEEQESEIEVEFRQRVEELEKELAAEKRSAQRAKKGQDSKASGVEEELRKLVQGLEEKLAQQASENQTIQKDYARQFEDIQTQKEAMEQRLADLKLKLREAREEAKSVRAELMTARQGPVMIPMNDVPKQAAAKTQKNRKRRANEIEEDEAAILTPSNLDARPKRPLKKRGLDHTLMGEKSAFSITPFLNKTVNMADTSVDFTVGGLKLDQEMTKAINFADTSIEFTAGGPKIVEPEKTSSASEPDSSGNSFAVEAPASTGLTKRVIQLTKTTKVPLKEPKARGRPKTKILGETALSKKNQKGPGSSKKPALLSEPTLDKVMEEADGPSTEQENRSAETTRSLTTSFKDSTFTTKTDLTRTSGITASMLDTEPKKKKRKLLGGGPKTIFGDDDEGEAAPPAKRKALGSRGLGKALSGLKRNAFGGTFSPLKREKRGVNASFLA